MPTRTPHTTKNRLKQLGICAAFVAAAVGLQTPVSAVDYASQSSATFSDPAPSKGKTITVAGKTVPFSVVVTSLICGTTTQTLATTTADANGDYSMGVTVPSTLPNNGICVLGVSVNNLQIASTPLSVAATGATTAATPRSSLPVTGSSAIMLVAAAGALVAVGGVAVGMSRRSAAEPVETV